MYKCINKQCDKFGIERRSGGRMRVVNGKITYTGSICKHCGKEMEEIKTEMPNYSVINYGDGRNA